VSAIVDQIVHLENLQWAWQKAKNAFNLGDMWFDEIAIAQFEANLDNELKNIANDVISGKFAITPIKPAGYPKDPDEKGNPRTRQTFYISVRDQVLWIAVTNVLGPLYDLKMPFWSFGNRLYVSVWYEDKENIEDNKKELRIGWYRHTSGHIYRKWNQSWPLYRRSIAITVKIMANWKDVRSNYDSFVSETLSDAKEQEMLRNNSSLPENLHIKYFDQDYWTQKLKKDIYWAAIDLKRFYPSVTIDSVMRGFRENTSAFAEDKDLEPLLHQLLTFPLDFEDWTATELHDIDLDEEQSIFRNIPTGLHIAGFLSNVALFSVDQEVNQRLNSERDVAHFRFVDDHVIITNDFDKLIDWITWYKSLLKKHRIGSRLNLDKTEPESLKNLLNVPRSKWKGRNHKKRIIAATKATKIDDPQFPSPLMTQTLAKVSALAAADFEILDESEEKELIADLEHLLITEFPDQELRRDTRVSFAATMLARIVPRSLQDESLLYPFQIELNGIRKQLEEAEKKAIRSDIDDLKEILDQKTKNLSEKTQSLDDDHRRSRTYVLQLMRKATLENHQKVRLWSRVLEYCMNSGAEDIAEILDDIKALKDLKIASDLSYDFLYAKLLQAISSLLIYAAHSVTGSNINQPTKKAHARFISLVLSEDFLSRVRSYEPTKYYSRRSVALFDFSLGSTIYYLLNNTKDFVINLDTAQLHRHRLIDWQDNPQKWISKFGYPFAAWVWWLTWEKGDKGYIQPDYFWTQALPYLRPSEELDARIICMYPRRLPEAKVRELILHRKQLNMFFENAGWKHELFAGQKKAIDQFVEMDSQLIETDVDGFMSLCQWIDWAGCILKDISSKREYFFDPRISEWTALSIALRITNIVKTEFNQLHLGKLSSLLPVADSIPIHPHNFMIARPLTDPSKPDSPWTWERWKTELNAVESIKVRTKLHLISDRGFTPTLYDPFGVQDRELSLVVGVGSILWGLLCLDFELPFLWNLSNYRAFQRQGIAQRLQEIAISSYTHAILESCFSDRNRETKFLRNSQRMEKFKPDDDTLNDPPEIFTLESLSSHLSYAISILKNNQITVQDHAPRQLIPISLDQLAKPRSAFKQPDIQEELLQ